MIDKPKFFPKAYGLKTQNDINELYDEWADSYDDEVEENGYVSPARTASALTQFLPLEAPIFDIGCGTGLSGVALNNSGFLNIHGSEINLSMLVNAKKKKVYKSLIQGTINNPFPGPPGTYDAIVAIGVIGAGAAPASLLRSALKALESGGLLAFTLNDAAMAQESCKIELKTVLDDNLAVELFSEYGPHLSSINIGSTVYILERI
ncbi:MAG: class I SAM-dependent methyltransferase [Rhodobacteraceae bacterium]|nr:class I SAM-dependent methyltransferase [Paracoccaceae bacterium]